MIVSDRQSSERESGSVDLVHGSPREPAWVSQLLAGSPWRSRANTGRAMSIAAQTSERFRLVRGTVQGANSLDARKFAAAVAALYLDIFQAMEAGAARFPIRIWNWIPSIHAPGVQGADRYMMFNEGRFEAFEKRLCAGGREAGSLEALLPTASGVGHGGEALRVDVLCAAEPGTPIENPRQVPSYQYSERYGKRPPCFARATVVNDLRGHGPWALIGGTASIVGEDSRHQRDLPMQLRETLANLSSVVEACSRARDSGMNDQTGCRDPLHRLKSLRIYHPRAADRESISRGIDVACPNALEKEYLLADLCRRELLVEIEGLAMLGAEAARG